MGGFRWPDAIGPRDGTLPCGGIRFVSDRAVPRYRPSSIVQTMHSTPLSVVAMAMALAAQGQYCRIQDHYADFIALRRTVHEGKVFYHVQVLDPPTGACYAAIVGRHPLIVDYLLQNHAIRFNNEKFTAIGDTADMNAAYLRALSADSTFNALMGGLMARAEDPSIPRDTLTETDLLDVAVKFFAIERISPDDHYVGRICVGLNSVAQTEPVKRPWLEAFAFSSIFKHLEGDSGLYEAFLASAKRLYEVNLGVDPNERLLRAQGAMFFLMRDSPTLQAALMEEYRANQAWLPFVLRPH